jgi:UV DNA damage repair endonuclease
MVDNSFDKTKVKFKKVYANLPDKIRNEDIILVIDKKSYTCNAVFFEVQNNSKLGIEMLKKLEEMGII